MSKENSAQREKFNQIKQKYDKEGLEVVEDESQIGKGTPDDARR